VKELGALGVPLHLRNAPTGLMRDIGYGKEYKYPHNFEGHYVIEEYLPEELKGKEYYTPAESGAEKEIKERLEKWRGKSEEEEEE
jgi:putative ATPase